VSGEAPPGAQHGRLATICRGGTGRRLVLVHGFTQTTRSWDPIVEQLAPGHRTVAVDAPGHGDSAHADAGLDEGARLLAEVGGTATYVGYSMGGRMCLHLALERPDLADGLVLIGATPGIEDDVERAARRRADDELAASIERDGVDAFLDRWLGQPLFATLTTAAPGLEDRRRNSPDGLAASLRNAGTGSQEPLWDRLGELDMPVLLVVGELDAKFTAVAEQMAARIGDVTVAPVAGAGHSAHLERPDVVVEILERWLDDHPPRTSPTEASAP